MELDITEYLQTAEHHDISASRAEKGENAGAITWGNAKAEASVRPLLTSDDMVQKAREFFEGFGAWSSEELAAMSADEINALTMQYISGDINEAEDLCSDADGAIDWAAYRKLSEAGTVRGNMYPCDIEGHESFGRVFYYLGD